VSQLAENKKGTRVLILKSAMSWNIQTLRHNGDIFRNLRSLSSVDTQTICNFQVQSLQISVEDLIH